MGKHLEKRTRLFSKFSNQLLLLKEQGLVTRALQFADPYLCPICLREFSADHLDEGQHRNFLTAEDAPPDKLGGSKIVLTCRECNNTCGHEIDCHLIEALRSIDDSYFYQGTKQQATIMFEGKRLKVSLESLGNGTLQAYQSKKNNDPSALERFIYGIKNGSVGPLLNLDPPPRKIIQKRINYALLKTNYILTFAKFGYLFLLDPQYDALRAQLLRPEQDIFPWTPFVKNQFSKEHIGTYYILNEDIRSILNVFMLSTGYSDTIIGGFVQSPHKTVADYGLSIDKKRDQNGSLIFQTNNYDPDADLFTNVQEMKKVTKWIYYV